MAYNSTCRACNGAIRDEGDGFFHIVFDGVEDGQWFRRVEADHEVQR